MFTLAQFGLQIIMSQMSILLSRNKLSPEKAKLAFGEALTKGYRGQKYIPLGQQIFQYLILAVDTEDLREILYISKLIFYN